MYINVRGVWIFVLISICCYLLKMTIWAETSALFNIAQLWICTDHDFMNYENILII